MLEIRPRENISSEMYGRHLGEEDIMPDGGPLRREHRWRNPTVVLPPALPVQAAPQIGLVRPQTGTPTTGQGSYS